MTSDNFHQVIGGASEEPDWFAAWESDPDLLNILTEFDWELYRQWLSKRLKCELNWPRDLCEVSMHKFRTAFKTVPMDLRRASKDWLFKTGWSPEDNGEIE